MYGIVNNAIKDLVVNIGGMALWQKVVADAGVSDPSFQNATHYSDESTLKLVSCACERLNLPMDEVLFEFGRHWVTYTNHHGWSTQFTLDGGDLVACLKQLDEVHARVKDAMPDAKMPLMSIIDNGETYLLEYHSEREGFAPMVLGVIQGLAEQFGEQWKIEQRVRRQDVGFDRFEMIRIDQNIAGGEQNAA